MFQPGILEHPKGTFSLCGSLPIDVCRQIRYPRTPGVHYTSRIYDKREDAEHDLKVAQILLVKDYLEDIQGFSEDRKAYCIAKWFGWS